VPVQSQKPAVIERLFFDRYDPSTRKLTRAEVTLDEVVAAIREVADGLSPMNPANFMKDIVRRANRNDYVPGSVLERGFTVEQYVGDRHCFRFVPLPAGQTTAFPELVPSPELLEDGAIHPIQSISLPLASRRMGRPDESWLTQVAVRLNLVHTHLALFSQQPVVALDLLQTGMKLGRGEIDSVFLATLSDVDEERYALVSCEVKSVKEVIEPEQVLRGAETVSAQASKLKLGDLAVIPMALKALGEGLLWLIEFSTNFPPLEAETEKIYRFVPPLKGVG
jgi:hypothetical protein